MKKKTLPNEADAKIYLTKQGPLIRYNTKKIDHDKMIQVLQGLHDLLLAQQSIRMFQELERKRIIQATAKDIATINRGRNAG